MQRSSEKYKYDLQYDYPLRTAFLFVVFLLLYETTTYIANDMIMPGMIYVTHSFNAPDSSIATSLSAYILGGASLQIFLGPLSDRYGRRPVMLSGVALFLLCTVFISISTSMQAFIIARFFQGMGLCYISVIGYAALQEMFSETHAVKLISIMGNVSIIAPLAGPLLGALLLMKYNWRAIFLVIAAFAAVALVGLWRYMPETVGVKKRDGSMNAQTKLNFKTIFENYKALLTHHAFLLGALSMGFAFIPIIAWIGVSPMILMDKANMSPIEYGLWQIPVFMGITLGNYVVRRYIQSFTLMAMIKYGTYIIISSLMLTALASFIFQANYQILIVGFSLYALGLGIITAPFNRVVLYLTDVPKGTASATISFFTMFLMSCGNYLAGYVYQSKNNFYFALCCALSVVIYAFLYELFSKDLQAPQFA